MFKILRLPIIVSVALAFATLTAIQPHATGLGACTETPTIGVLITCSTPGVTTMTVPDGATMMDVVVTGGGGGGGRVSAGGAGAVVSASIFVEEINSLWVTVAGGGKPYSSSAIGENLGGSSGGGTLGSNGTFGTGGTGGGTPNSEAYDASATGGGLSAITIGGATQALDSLLVIAGGGGGGGGVSHTAGGSGAGTSTPAAPSSSGGDGENGNSIPRGAFGGTNGTGGNGGGTSGMGNPPSGAANGGDLKTGSLDSWGKGGDGKDYGPSGGAGYGGGGGVEAYSSLDISGAGAGGSFVNGDYDVLGTATYAPSSTSAGSGGAGAVGAGDGGLGGNGEVQLYFYSSPDFGTPIVSAITSSSARISTTVVANSAITSSLTLKYSTSQATVDNGGGTSAVLSPASASGILPVAVSADISGLPADSLIYYQFSGINTSLDGNLESISTLESSSFRTLSNSGGGSTPTPASTQSEVPIVVQAPVTENPVQAQEPPISEPVTLPPANLPQSQVIGPGIRLVSESVATKTPSRTMKHESGTSLSKSPTVKAKAGVPTKIITGGLDPNSIIVVKMKKRGGKYQILGTVMTDPTGVLKLPVFSVSKAGKYVIALTSSATPTRYIRLTISPN